MDKVFRASRRIGRAKQGEVVVRQRCAAQGAIGIERLHRFNVRVFRALSSAPPIGGNHLQDAARAGRNKTG